ncbi:hypothetical protein MicroSTF_14540 [Microbacterium sp. STF-2]|uniref:hypothetical protein n=1 Tax=Microbacterium sp. STF-2 TaxID=3031132 RepID=UPI002AFEF21A|nr:hypothetical protein [Microbacterium sp. STF-2]MEA1264258.1 hypothetical protein [Microbacterium sp. STF-2]
MPFGFVNGAYNRASGTLDAFAGLSADLEREGHPPMVSLSGDREPEDQLRIWYERMTLTPNGRKVYGKRVWQGKTWYQIHPDTVGVPDTSNHEKRRSNDLKWPYNDRTTAAHKRARILATRHNITCEGLSFSEAWHWTHWGPIGVIASPAGAGSSMPADPEKKSDPKEHKTMKRLMQIDPKVDGRWFVVDYLAGTAVRQWNGFQLDRCREDIVRGELIELGGPQTPAVIQGLKIING